MSWIRNKSFQIRNTDKYKLSAYRYQPDHGMGTGGDDCTWPMSPGTPDAAYIR